MLTTVTNVSTGAASNNIAPNMAVWKFFEDIEKNYDTKLGYDSKLIGLKSEMERTNNELIILQRNLANRYQFGWSWVRKKTRQGFIHYICDKLKQGTSIRSLIM
ncbi:MAG TPA: hypothetical protein VEH06_07295, partial [Candidatus Bathyarchaeia archaeon]|nr:hypothetical protein [Candidatus Bathyarchaeia archaeon]